MAKKKTSTLTLKNYHLHKLGEFLFSEPLHGKQSISRNRFLRLIAERRQEIENYRRELLGKFSKKDADGKPVLSEDKKNYELESPADFMKEFNEYLLGDLNIELTTDNKDTINTVKSILAESNKTFYGEDAILYEEWITAFDSI